MKTIKYVLIFIAVVACGCPGEPAGETCIVEDDHDVQQVGARSQCTFLTIAHPTLASLDAFTDVAVVRLTITDSPLLQEVTTFFEVQDGLATVEVAGAPLESPLAVSSPILEYMALQGTAVRGLSIDSPVLDSLLLRDNPLETATFSMIRALLVEDEPVSTLAVFDEVTTLVQLAVRRTSLTTATIEEFAAQQESDVEVEHCGNADDEPCVVLDLMD